MFSSSSKRRRFNWAILCLVFSFLFVAGASASFACSKKCAAKSGSQKCPLHSEATSESSQPASDPQSTEKQAGVSGLESQTAVAQTTANFPVKERYTCPMHPDVMKKKAGACPKCGMNLEKKEFYEVYACPMPDCPYLSEKSGKCACGMKLKKKLISKEEYEKLSQPQMSYFCSMHPEISSGKPGNCPKCGMKLEMKKPVSKE